MVKIVFLHRSTGLSIYRGKTNPYVFKFTKAGDIKSYFNKYNRSNKTNFSISEQHFASPLSSKNYPYDYYNIWVKNAGDKPFMNVSTLEILTADYDVIVFKHCFSASNIMEDTGKPDIESENKRIENYKLHYNALKNKMYEFPKTKFIIWTPAVHVKNLISVDEAQRTHEFYKWIIDEWDEKGDNIYIWDFYKYETEGELFFNNAYAISVNDSHPGKEFSARMAPILGMFIIDVAEGKIE
jgi:hypothetical protein